MSRAELCWIYRVGRFLALSDKTENRSQLWYTIDPATPGSDDGEWRAALGAQQLHVGTLEECIDACYRSEPEGLDKYVVPAMPYGMYEGAKFPRARSVPTAANIWNDPSCVMKLWEDIVDEDRCQRGPDGKPLSQWTPFVPLQTKAEWDAAGELCKAGG